ncbi:signal peptide protein, partial [Burkholderia pseudomallei]|nr:signal peptide protein [Burkholderia pseudomallei]
MRPARAGRAFRFAVSRFAVSRFAVSRFAVSRFAMPIFVVLFALAALIWGAIHMFEAIAA